MAVTVLVSGIPHHVTLSNLAYNLNYLFDTDEIGTFNIREILNNGPKRQIALDFKSGFDAMTAQDMLDGYRYDVHNEEYVLKAKITNNESLLPNSSASWNKDQSLSLISKYSEKSYARANQKLDAKLLFLKKQKLVVDAERDLIKSKKRLAREYKKRTISTSSEEEKPKKRRKKSKRDSSESSLSDSKDAECSKTRAKIRSTVRKSSRSPAKKSKSRNRSRTRIRTSPLNKLPPGQMKCLESIKFEPEGNSERARSKHRRDRKSSSTDRGSPLRVRRSPSRVKRSPSRARRTPSRVRWSPSRSRYSPLRQIYSSRHRHSSSPEFHSPLREIHSPSPQKYYTDYYSYRKKSPRVDSHHRKYSDERDRDSNYYRAPTTSHQRPASIDLKEELNELKLREIKAAVVQEIMTENTKYLQLKMNEIGDAVTDADFHLIIAEVKEAVEKKFKKLVVAKYKSTDEVFNMYKKEFDCSDDFKLIQKLLDEVLAFNSKFMSGSNKYLQTAHTVSLSPKKSISQPLPKEDNKSQGLQHNSNKDKSVEQIWCMVDEVLHDVQIDELKQEDAEENRNTENTNLNLASVNNDPTPEQQFNVIVSNKPPAAPETTEKNITITDKDVLDSVRDDITEDKERSANDNLNVETVSVQQTDLCKAENNVIDLTNNVYDVITTKGADSLNNLQTESVIVIKRERQDVYRNNGDSIIEPELVVPIAKIMKSFRSAIQQLKIPPEKFGMIMEFIKLFLLVELRSLLDERPIMAAKNVVEIFRLYHPIHEDQKYLSEILKQGGCFAPENYSEYKNISAKDIQNNELVVLKTRNVPAIEHDNDVIYVENDPVVIEIYDDDTQNNELVVLKTRNVPVIDNDVSYVENNPVVIEIYDDESETINKFPRRSTAVSNQKDKQANITTSLGSTNVISSNTCVILDAKTNMTVQNSNRRNKTDPSINTKNINRPNTTNCLSNIKINQNKNANRKTIHFTNNTKSGSYNPYEDKSSYDYIVTAILNMELYLICGIAKSSGINPYIMPGFVTALKSIISNRLDSCLPYLISTYGRLDLTIVRDYYRSYYPLTSNVVLLQQLLYNLFGIHHHINHTEGSSTNSRQITERNPLDTPDKNELVNTDKKDKVIDIFSNSHIKKSQNKLETENKKIEYTPEDNEETIEGIKNFLNSSLN